MEDQQRTPRHAPGATGMSRAFAGIAERSQFIVNDWLQRNKLADACGSSSDPFGVATLFLDLTTRMMAIPASMVSAQMTLWQDYFTLWQSTTTRMLGAELPMPSASGRHGDGWHDADIFAYVKQSFMLTSRWVQAMADAGSDGGRKLRDEMDLYARQFLSALSPSEFTHANPEMLRATIESGGENLITGLQNLLKEMEVGLGPQGSAARDPASFAVGRTVARTPGKVIFRNALMEVIQYAPRTERVLRRPLLFVPGWTGKYYLLDLRDRNSLVRWAVDCGHTVFMISWVDPGADTEERSFEDYVVEGAVTALDVVGRATGGGAVNAVGHGQGGTLLAAALAYLAAGNEGHVGTGSFLTTLLDFSQPGELGALIDEATLGLLDGANGEAPDDERLSETCVLQRENDLLWSFVVNNHLLGNDPFPFDLLHWNRDAPRLPRTMHGGYLDALYRHNKLAEPGGLTIGGRPIDLRRVSVPSYVMSAREDHIAPWKSAYRAIRMLGGADRFTLAASGHLAGVVNPPAGARYCYWTNPRTPENPDEWRAGAKPVEGSWWADWDAWIRKRSGGDWVSAREPGGGGLEPLCDAPGIYVRSTA
jgi:polyhydroxyalkanoate synthase subunit PhaC